MGSYLEFVFWSATVSAVFILTLPGTAVSANMVTTSCPSSLEDNKTAEIQCTVNSTGISNANCSVPPITLTFELTSPSGSVITFCVADYPCNLSSTASKPCGCISSDNGIYKYTFSFLANKTVHDGTTVKSTFVCPGGSVSYGDNGHCNSLKFNSTFGSTPSSNVTDSTSGSTSTPNVTASYDQVEVSDCSESCIIAISVTLAVVGIVVVIIGVLCCCGVISCTCCPPRCYCCKQTTKSLNSSQEAKPEPNATPLNEAPKAKPSV